MKQDNNKGASAKSPKKPKKGPVGEKSKDEAAEYLDKWKRAKADLANYTKQVQAERTAVYSRLTSQLLTSLLPLADNFQAMLAHTPPELVDNSWVTGVIHIGKQVDDILTEYGAVQMEVGQEEFNPKRHEAIEEVEVEGVTSGTVVEVLQPGYLVADQVLRPAKVKVAK